jgi:DNA replication protein DnaC
VGESGAGKTAAMWYLIYGLKKKGYVFEELPGSDVAGYLNDHGSSFSNNEIVGKLKKVGLLCINDFGKGHLNSVVAPVLFEIIDERIEYRRPMVITTRYTTDLLIERIRSESTIGEDLARRIRDYFEPIIFKVPKG